MSSENLKTLATTIQVAGVIPTEFTCAIAGTSELMNEPVTLVETGRTYERYNLEKWLLGEKKYVDPVTNQYLTDKRFFPNIDLKNAIENFVKTKKIELPTKILNNTSTAQLDGKYFQQSIIDKNIDDVRTRLDEVICYLYVFKKNKWIMQDTELQEKLDKIYKELLGILSIVTEQNCFESERYLNGMGIKKEYIQKANALVSESNKLNIPHINEYLQKFRKTLETIHEDWKENENNHNKSSVIDIFDRIEAIKTSPPQNEDSLDVISESLYSEIFYLKAFIENENICFDSDTKNALTSLLKTMEYCLSEVKQEHLFIFEFSDVSIIPRDIINAVNSDIIHTTPNKILENHMQIFETAIKKLPENWEGDNEICKRNLTDSFDQDKTQIIDILKTVTITTTYSSSSSSSSSTSSSTTSNLVGRNIYSTYGSSAQISQENQKKVTIALEELKNILCYTQTLINFYDLELFDSTSMKKIHEMMVETGCNLDAKISSSFFEVKDVNETKEEIRSLLSHQSAYELFENYIAQFEKTLQGLPDVLLGHTTTKLKLLSQFETVKEYAQKNLRSTVAINYI